MQIIFQLTILGFDRNESNEIHVFVSRLLFPSSPSFLYINPCPEFTLKGKPAIFFGLMIDFRMRKENLLVLYFS